MRSLLFILTLLAISPVVGQKLIRLENHQSGKVKWIEEGRKVKLEFNDSIVKGEYNVLNDSTISVDSIPVYLSQIEWITAKTDASKVAGAVLIVAGTGLNVLGIVTIASPKDHWMDFLIMNSLGAISLGAGTAMTLNGALFYAVGYKHYSKKWNMSIQSIVSPDEP